MPKERLPTFTAVFCLFFASSFFCSCGHYRKVHDIKIESIGEIHDSNGHRFSVKIINNGQVVIPAGSYSIKIYLNDEVVAFVRSKDSSMLESGDFMILTTPYLSLKQLGIDYVIKSNVEMLDGYEDYDLSNNSLTK